MRKLIFLCSLLILFLVVSCKKEIDYNQDKSHPINKATINGFVQKGPFINGTSISINELKNDLSQTGKIFNTQITDNKGSFEFRNIELVSSYISLRADGFYFNEITGEQSTAQITLYAISDISDKSTINVNLLSHLEKPRVEFLIDQKLSFSQAKKQAQSEILKIFGFSIDTIENSELLDISKNGNGNAVLLASSLLLLGNRTEAELTELLSNLSNDIKVDGILNNRSLGSQLINHAVNIDTISIRLNLEKRYSDLGLDVQVPNFEKYIVLFLENTDYEYTNNISYPKETEYGLNILNDSITEVFTYNPLILKEAPNYSLSSELNKGNSIKVIITKQNSCNIYSGFGCTYWYIWEQAPFTTNNWKYTEYRDIDGLCTIPSGHTQTFSATYSNNDVCNLRLHFAPIAENGCSIKIDIYENNSEIPTKSKIVNVNMVK